LKASRNVSINYLSNSNKILTGHSSLFKLIGIRFLNTAKESHRLEILLPSMVPSENPIFINTFTEVISGIYQDMLETMTKSQVDKTMSKVNLVYDASLVYCWHFINMAYNNNLVDKVIEELYLLKEIEAFKNRKGE
jgi:hypothetical protein